jgi:hypothetical protein
MQQKPAAPAKAVVPVVDSGLRELCELRAWVRLRKRKK